jgi:hypothetical protein
MSLPGQVSCHEGCCVRAMALMLSTKQAKEVILSERVSDLRCNSTQRCHRSLNSAAGWV